MGRPERKPKRSATHAVDGAALKRYQRQKVWSNAELSYHSHVPIKTIDRARNGERIELTSIDKLAEVLELPREKLLFYERPTKTIHLPTGEDIKVPVNSDRRFGVQLAIGIPYQEFNKSGKMIAFMAVLRRLINGSDSIHIKEVKEGSTLVALEMSTQDILRMLAEMLDGNLQNMDVISVRLSDHSWLLRMIVCLKVLGTPVEPDVQTWSDMLNSNMMDGVFGDTLFL